MKIYLCEGIFFPLTILEYCVELEAYSYLWAPITAPSLMDVILTYWIVYWIVLLSEPQ